MSNSSRDSKNDYFKPLFSVEIVNLFPYLNRLTTGEGKCSPNDIPKGFRRIATAPTNLEAKRPDEAGDSSEIGDAEDCIRAAFAKYHPDGGTFTTPNSIKALAGPLWHGEKYIQDTRKGQVVSRGPLQEFYPHKWVV